jgi:hypothetical protein
MNGFQPGFSGLREDLCRCRRRGLDVHYNPFQIDVSAHVPQWVRHSGARVDGDGDPVATLHALHYPRSEAAEA